jgi:hypothetical protein
MHGVSMASVIQLARYRSIARHDLPLEIPSGDSDLRPIAVLLWIGSVVRVVLAFWHRETFDIEATLALFCALGIPLLFLRSRHAHDTVQQ